MKKQTALVFLCLAGAAALPAFAADSAREAEVARRGAEVMPFDPAATTHVFTKTADGGVQKVVAKRIADRQQVRLVREHLRALRTDFSKGDFSGPSRIHGDEMPGLAALKAAAPGRIAVRYREVAGGAELTFRTRDPQLVTALHEWMDAQLSDHGTDAMEGHMHHHDAAPAK